jgi:transcriptional regulator GlxA family with amidase domain
MSDQTISVLVVGFDDAELLDIACVTSTLAMAAEFGADPVYEVRLLTPGGHPVTAQPGLRLEAHGALERHTGPVDTLVVSGGHGHRRAARDEVLVAHVRRLARDARRVASVCTGATVLAAAGLLDGRRATTHWHATGLFREWYPQVELDPNVLFVDEGDVLTSAGAAAGIDVCLHLVRKDHGSEIANRVARTCVVPPWRDGGQAQYIEHPVPDATANDTSAARQWALQNLHKPLTLSDLAEQSNMSLRTFARRFKEEVGLSPGRWLIQQRVDRARHLLESTDLAVDDIAGQVGFAGGTSLREHLHAALGVSPLAYRRTFRGVSAQNH